MHACTLYSLCVMVILPGYAKWLPFWDSVSKVGDAVPTCFQCYVKVPVLGCFPSQLSLVTLDLWKHYLRIW